MARNFEFALDAWVRDLSKEEKAMLRDYHCEILVSLRFVRLDFNFLLAAFRFWNPNTHTFCFRNNEITPLPEELSAIVNWPFDNPPCVPNVSEYYYNEFGQFLGLENQTLHRIVHGLEVNLIALIDHFRGMGRVSPAHRRRALVFCLFCRFLFVHEVSNYGRASLLSIIEQCELSKSPMPLCTGELMLSLDILHNDPASVITGCPHVLQVQLNLSSR